MPKSPPFPGIHNFHIPYFVPGAHPHQPHELLHNIHNAQWRAQRRDEVHNEEVTHSERDIAVVASER